MSESKRVEMEERFKSHLERSGVTIEEVRERVRSWNPEAYDAFVAFLKQCSYVDVVGTRNGVELRADTLLSFGAILLQKAMDDLVAERGLREREQSSSRGGTDTSFPAPCDECPGTHETHAHWCPHKSACEMVTELPYPFGQCSTHDETFPLGGACKYHRSDKDRCCVFERCSVTGKPTADTGKAPDESTPAGGADA